MLVSQQRLGDVSKDMPLALLTRTILRQVETTQHHILAGSNRWFTSSWSKQVARRGIKEVQHGRVFPGWRVHHIDDNLRASRRLRQAFTRQRVDSSAGGCGDDFVAEFAQVLDELRPDQASSAENDDLHVCLPKEMMAV